MGMGSRDLERPGLLVAGLLVLLLCVLVTSSGEGVSRPTLDRDPPASTGDERAEETVEQVDEVREDSPGDQGRPGNGAGVLVPGRLAALVLLAAVLMLVAGILLRLRLSLRGRRPREGRLLTALDPGALLTEEAQVDEGLTDALTGGLADLATGSPRNSIVAAWLRLEAAAESQNFHRDPADTPTEFVAHLLASYDLDGDAIDRLAALYREARFSEHALGEPQRAEAVACLTDLLAGLPGSRTARRAR